MTAMADRDAVRHIEPHIRVCGVRQYVMGVQISAARISAVLAGVAVSLLHAARPSRNLAGLALTLGRRSAGPSWMLRPAQVWCRCQLALVVFSLRTSALRCREFCALGFSGWNTSSVVAVDISNRPTHDVAAATTSRNGERWTLSAPAGAQQFCQLLRSWQLAMDALPRRCSPWRAAAMAFCIQRASLDECLSASARAQHSHILLRVFA